MASRFGTWREDVELGDLGLVGRASFIYFRYSDKVGRSIWFGDPFNVVSMYMQGK